MSASHSQFMTVHLPFDLLIEVVRRLASRGEYRLSETLVRYALACDSDDPSARKWLEFSLEAQGEYSEAYFIHIEKKPWELTELVEKVDRENRRMNRSKGLP